MSKMFFSYCSWLFFVAFFQSGMGFANDKISIIVKNKSLTVEVEQPHALDAQKSLSSSAATSPTRAKTYQLLEVSASEYAELVKRDDIEILGENFPLYPNVQTVDLEATGVLSLRDTGSANAFQGDGKTVVVIDSGVELEHPHLETRLVPGACFGTNRINELNNFTHVSHCARSRDDLFIEESSLIGGDAGKNCRILNASPEEIAASYAACTHGTHIAGIITGTIKDSVAPLSKVMPIQVFSEVYQRFINEENNPFQLCREGLDTCQVAMVSDVLRALDWLNTQADTTDIAAINLSIGGLPSAGVCDNESPLHQEFNQLTQALADKGIVTVAAAGNQSDNNSIDFPACLSAVVAVGASESTFSLGSLWAPFSNDSDVIELVAPGDSIDSSTWQVDIDLDGELNDYAAISGTSQSTAFVSGAAAVLSAIPVDGDLAKTGQDIRRHLLQTSDFVTSPNRTHPLLDLVSAAEDYRRPGVKFSNSPTSIIVNSTENLTLQSYGINQANLNYFWDFDYQSTAPGFITGSKTQSHTFATPGNYTIAAYASEGERESVVMTQDVTVYDPVVVMIPILGLLL
ncbi:MAG: S8 family serine peptidase [Pseudomonadota bacterium]